VLWSAASLAGSATGHNSRSAKDHGLDPLRFKRYFRPLAYGYYLGAERYDKFDIWKMMADNDTVTREFGRLMERFDLLAGVDDGDPASQGRWTLFALSGERPDRLCDIRRRTIPANETGRPGISLSAGRDRVGV